MTASALDWAVAARPLRGEVVSGDQHLVAPFPGGALMAVLDGLGHGPSAAAAARTAIEVLAAVPGEPVVALVNRCHAALGRLRGVVMSLASFDVAARRMSWVGVGNVEGVLIRTLEGLGVVRERLLGWGGIVGQSVATPRSTTLPLAPSDLIIFATDGLHPGFVDAALLEQARRRAPVADIADQLLQRHALERDDALVLVARYQGDAA